MVEIDGSSDVKGESLMEKIEEKIHGHDSSSSSSSSDSETEKKSKPVTPVKNKIYRLFGRERPVHKVLGGRKPADIFLWRNKKISAAVLGGVTAIWVLFELLEYHLLTLVCHILMVSLALLFLWANASSFINKSPPRIPDVRVSEDIFLEVATALQIEINGALAFLRDVGSGRDLKKFLAVIAVFWVLSLVGSCGNFLTLFYICFLLLHTLPVFYEKYDHQIDACAEKAMIQIKRQYALFDAKVLSKIPRGKPKNKKA